MKNLKQLEKRIDVKDVDCANCIHYYRYTTPMKGYCDRFNKHSSECRALCVKTQWYAEMCVLNAAVDAQFT